MKQRREGHIIGCSEQRKRDEGIVRKKVVQAVMNRQRGPLRGSTEGSGGYMAQHSMDGQWSDYGITAAASLRFARAIGVPRTNPLPL